MTGCIQADYPGIISSESVIAGHTGDHCPTVHSGDYGRAGIKNSTTVLSIPDPIPMRTEADNPEFKTMRLPFIRIAGGNRTGIGQRGN
jgi:hypothetical protein